MCGGADDERGVRGHRGLGDGLDPRDARVSVAPGERREVVDDLLDGVEVDQLERDVEVGAVDRAERLGEGALHRVELHQLGG